MLIDTKCAKWANKGEHIIKTLTIPRWAALRRRPQAVLGLVLLSVVSMVCSVVWAQSAGAFGTGGPVTGIAGKCLENKDGTAANGNKIQLGTCDGSTKQVWQWHGDMSMRVQGFCLDVQTSGTAPGTTVQLWTCNGTGAQRWYTLANGTLKNQNSNLCLQTVGSASANGTGVEINTCNAGNSAQQWTISSSAIVEMPLFDGAPHNPLPSGPQTPAPTITLDYSQMPQWGAYMEQVAKPFMQDWYRALVDHYSYPDHGAVTAFTVLLDPAYSGAAAVSGGTTIRINPGYYGYSSQQAIFQDNMVHEMTHIVQHNPAQPAPNEAPSWVIEAWADDARYNFYGRPKPSLGADALYVGGYDMALTVLERAQQQSGGTFMKALSNADWNGTYSYNIFKQVSGSTPAEHWHALTNDTVSEATVSLTNALSGKCVDLPSAASADGTRMSLLPCTTGQQDAKTWAFKAPQGSSEGIIRGVYGAPGKCMSVQANATANGSAVEYRGCNSASNPGQKWKFVGGTLRNPNSGKCLQPVGGLQANGTQLEIQPCDGSSIQQWTLPPIVKQAVAPVISKVLYPATFSDGQQGIGTTDALGNGYNRILTAPANNTYSKPRLSPDGSKVAFLQNQNGQQTATLRVANADGTSNTQLTTNGYFISTSAPLPLWSSDNSKVLVAVTPTGQTAVDEQWKWLWVNVDGSGQQLLTSATIGGSPFAVTSTKVFFVNDSIVEQQLCSVNSSDGSGEACFGQATDPKSAALSTDGARIASVATGTVTSFQVTGVGSSTSSSISLSSLGSGLTNVEAVTWVPNTTKVAFRAVVSGRTAWYTVDGVNPGQISKLNIDGNPITWHASAAPTLLYGAYNGLTPFRITDTRAGSGKLNAGKTLAPQGTLDIQVSGLGGVPAEGVSAVVLNITAPPATASGYLTVYPAGTTRPDASTVNTTTNKVVNNQTTVGLGTDGKVSIYNFLGATDVVVDIVGYYSENGGSFAPTAPKRVFDSRSGSPLAANGTMDVQVTGVQGIPSNAAGVVADVTEVGATANSFLTLYPSGTTTPDTSSLNYSAGEILTKEVSVKLGANGALTVKNGPSGTTHFIIDVVGYYTNDMGGMSYMPINPSRIADTRAGSGKPYAGQPITQGAVKLFAISGSLMPANAAAVVNNLTVPVPATANTYLTAFPANVGTVPGATSVTYVNSVAFNQSTVQLSSGPSGGFKVYNHLGTTDVVIDSLGYYY